MDTNSQTQMTKHYCCCEACFLNPTEAEIAVDKLAAFGINATAFPEIKDECSDATRFYGLWRECELPVPDDNDTLEAWRLGRTNNAELDFFEAKVQVALEHERLGSADIFVLLDHPPVAKDFYDVDAP
jgi:hypothetical protein